MDTQSANSWVKRSFPGRWVGLVGLSCMVLSLIVLPISVSAQDTTASPLRLASKSKLPEVTVTATRTPESVYDVPQYTTVLDTGYIQKTQPRSVGDMTRHIPGITVNNGAPRRIGQRINIRGLSQEQVIVRRDGARIAQSSSGHDGNLFFDLSNVKKVEVVKGPSALYGSGALGGVVTFETYDPADLLQPGERRGSRVSYSYSGAFGENTATGKVYGRSRNGSFSWLVGLTSRDADDTVELASNDPTDPNELNFAEEDIIHPNGKFIYEPDDVNRVEVSYDFYENEGTTLSNLDDTSVATTSGAVVERTTENQTINLNYDRTGDKWWEKNVQATLYYNGMDRSEDRGAPGVDNIEYETLGLDVQNTIDHGIHEITYGIEYVEDEQSSSTTRAPGGNANTFFPDAGQEKTGYFIQDKISLRDGKLTLTPAVRFDDWENDPDSAALNARSADETSFQFGAVYQLSDRWKVTGNYSEGFRAPDLQELYNSGLHFAFTVPFPPPPTTFREFFIPNPDLKPETSENLDFGLRYQTEDLKARVNYYEINVDDFIESQVVGSFFTPPMNQRNRQAQNVSQAELTGEEASLEWDLSERWDLMARYANPEGRNLTSDTKLQSVPAENLTFGAEWQALEDLTLGGFSRSFSGKTTPSGEFSGYTVFDAYAEWTPSKSARINLSVNNLTDNAFTEATTGRPGVAQDVRASFTYFF